MKPSPSPGKARLCIVVAAILWSLSGAFSKTLTDPTPLGTHLPPIQPRQFFGLELPLQTVCYRGLFAALALTPFLKRRDLSFRPTMLVMGLAFASMSLFFITANAIGTAANATFLQYSAPFWMYLATLRGRTGRVGEPSYGGVGDAKAGGDAVDRRGTISLFAGLFGIGVIVAGGWQDGQLLAVALALASGFAYAAVVVCLRLLRAESSRWLTVWNLGISGLILMPFVVGLEPPSPAQFVVLFFFGVTQMALPYWLMARALRVVSPAEAGTLSLLEPLLNPLWTYLIAGERPTVWTFVGGAIVLAALAWRYAPGLRGSRTESA